MGWLGRCGWIDKAVTNWVGLAVVAYAGIVVAGMIGLLPWQISTSEWLIGLCGLADGPIERKVRRQCP